MSLKGSNFVAGLSLLIFYYFCFLATMLNETVVRRWGDLRRKVQVGQSCGQSDGRSLFRNIF